MRGCALLRASSLAFCMASSPPAAARYLDLTPGTEPCGSGPWHVVDNTTALLHLVVTRFSLSQGNLSTLVHLRLMLLDAVTRASLTAQHSCRFTWLVYHDSTLPLSARNQLRAIVEGAGNGRFSLVEIPDGVAAPFDKPHYLPVQQQLQRIGRWIPAPARRAVVLSTRLDADDALSKSAVDKLQRHALRSLPCRGKSSGHLDNYVSCWVGAYMWHPRGNGSLGWENTAYCLSATTRASCNTMSKSPYVGNHVSMPVTPCKFRPSVSTAIAGNVAGLFRTSSVSSNSGITLLPATVDLTPGRAAWLDSTFGILVANLSAVSRWLASHTAQIAAEQGSIRCRRGFSCRPQAREGWKALAGGRRLTESTDQLATKLARNGRCPFQWNADRVRGPDPGAPVRNRTTGGHSRTGKRLVWRPTSRPPLRSIAQLAHSCGDDPSSQTPRTTRSAFANASVPEPPFLHVVRILGNDMPPVHAPGQTRLNALFAARYEVVPPRVRVTYLLNNIFNQTEQARLEQELCLAGARVVKRSVDPRRIAAFGPEVRSAVNYVTDQNGARNQAVGVGSADGSRWIWPSDSNQFLTAQMWTQLIRVLKESDTQGLPAALLPMIRIPTPDAASKLRAELKVSDVVGLLPAHLRMVSEPQLVVRNTLNYTFPEGIAYGAGNKLMGLNDMCSRISPPAHCCGKRIVRGRLQHGGESTPLREHDINALANQCGVSLRLHNFPTGAERPWRAVQRKRAPTATERSIGRLVSLGLLGQAVVRLNLSNVAANASALPSRTDWECYLKRYSDLPRTWGLSRQHSFLLCLQWTRYGRFERRKPYCDRDAPLPRSHSHLSLCHSFADPSDAIPAAFLKQWVRMKTSFQKPSARSPSPLPARANGTVPEGQGLVVVSARTSVM